MYKVGEFVLYKGELCKIKEKKEMFGLEYYGLELVKDASLKISIPVSESEHLLKSIMTKEEIMDLLDKIPDIDIITSDQKNLEGEYKKLLSSGKKEDLISIIKTSYLRNEKRKEEKRKLSEVDSYYFHKAEEYLYDEIGFTLNLTFEETREFLKREIAKKTKI